MLDKIKGLKKYTDSSMPTNENELRQKESVAGYNQAIEDVVKIFSIHDVSQQRELLNAFAFYMVKNSNPNDGMTYKDYVEQWLSI